MKTKSIRSFFIFTSVFIFSIIKFLPVAHAQDSRANSIADSVLLAMGGKEYWDNTRFIKWTFFGKRNLYWDKFTGNVRIEIPARQLVIITNINSGNGKVFRNKTLITQPDSILYFMDRGYKIWANDSYWLVLPFKLKDPGAILNYLGIANDSSGNNCFLLQLTFNHVGVTPENKYHVYVDRKSYHITQWAYFEKYTDKNPEIITPWKDYKQYGNIMLSGNRGRQGELTEIIVSDYMPPEWFELP